MVTAFGVKSKCRKACPICVVRPLVLVLALTAWIGLPMTSQAADPAEKPDMQGKSWEAPKPAETDWTQWRGAGRDSVSLEKGLHLNWAEEPPAELWRANVGFGYSQAIVQKDRLYTMGWNWKTRQDMIWCLSAETGEIFWRTDYPAESGVWVDTGRGGCPCFFGPRATPALDGGKLYTFAADSQALCVDAATGKILWRRDIEKELACQRQWWWDYCGSPLIVGDKVVLAIGGGVALDKTTGETVWVSARNGSTIDSPVWLRTGGKDYVTYDGRLLDADNGKVVWTFENGHYHDPVLVGNNQLLTNDDRRGLKLTTIGGADLWKNVALFHYIATPVVLGGFIYNGVGQYAHTLVCADPKDGSQKWREAKVKPAHVIVADGKLIAQGSDGTVWAVEATPEKCTILGEYQVVDKPRGETEQSWTMPSVSGGRLYSRTGDGILVALDLRGKKAGDTPPAAKVPGDPRVRLCSRDWYRKPMASPPKYREPTDADWPQWRGPQRNGQSPDTGLQLDWNAATPKPLWKANVGFGTSAVSVVGDRLYANGVLQSGPEFHDAAFCLDARTGELIWTKDLGSGKTGIYVDPERGKFPAGMGPRSAPTVSGGRVYLFYQDARATCFEADSGKVVWTVKLGQDFDLPAQFCCGSPLVLDKTVVLSLGVAGVGLDKETGQVLWATGKEAGGQASPALFDQSGAKRLAVFGKDRLCTLDSAPPTADATTTQPATAKVLWQFPWDTGCAGTRSDAIPAGDGKLLAFGPAGKGAALLTVGSDKVVWENKALDPQVATPVFHDGFLYGPSQTSGEMLCLDAKDGAVKWHEKMDATQVIWADGKLVIQCRDGEVRLADATPDGYRPRGACRPLDGNDCWALPAICGGKMYCRSYEGDVVALDLKAPVPVPARVPQNVESLLAKLGSPTQAERDAAVAGLVLTTDKDLRTAVPALVKALGKDNWVEQTTAAEALRKLGPKAKAAGPDLTALATKAIQSHDWTLAGVVIETLGAVDAASVKNGCPALGAALHDPDAQVQRNALEAVRHLGPVVSALVGDVAGLMGSQNEEVARVANLALGSIGPAAQDSVPALVEAVGKGPFRQTAILALTGIGPAAKSAIPALLGAVKGADSHGKEDIAFALTKIKVEDAPPVTQDAQTTCTEGQTILVKLSFTDEDDLAENVKTTLVTPPAHGTAHLTDPTTAEYHARYGHAGKDTFAWKASDEKSDSRVATVTVDVAPRTQPPAVESVIVSASLTTMTVSFSRPMAKATAEQAANYKIGPAVTVQKATQDNEGGAVTLATSKLAENTTCTLTISGLRDRTSKANELPSAPFRFRTVAPVAGLATETFDRPDFSGKAERKIDAKIDFAQGPVPDHDNYSVRWTGRVRPKVSDTYTFRAVARIGARLWLNGCLVDMATKGGFNGTTDMQAGHVYDIRLEFVRKGGTEPALSLHWTARSGNKDEVIPADCLLTAPIAQGQ
jgi:outer membrane protein assembly factor BamB/HEAT repeat protein